MRILYVGRNARIGGGSTFRLNIARGLRARGHEIWLACQPGEVLPRFRELGVHYVWTPPAPWGGPWIERAIRANGIDLVHASNATPGKAAEWACARTGTPLVLSIHGFLGKEDHRQSCLQSARKVLSFEEVAVQHLSRKGVIDMSKVVLLRRPIEHRPGQQDEHGPFRIVSVGRLSRRKSQNALSLLQAFAEFRKEVPNSTLDIAGDGSRIWEVRRAAWEYNRQHGSQPVRVLGALAEPVPLMGRAHVVVGASYCALEAIMQGGAVIGTGFWGYGIIDRENLRDAMAWNFGDVGGQWKPTPENFLQALRTLHAAWGNRRERDRYWRLDHLIVEDHSLENVAGRIESIYQEVLRGRAPQPAVAPAFG